MRKRRCIPLLVIIALMLALVVLWGVFACGMHSLIEDSVSPSKPLITHNEFPFTVVYELDGEEITLNDTVICEYTGDEWSDAHMLKFRAWNKTYSSGVDEIVLFQKSTDEYIVLNTGYSAEFLMGDTEHFRYNCSRTCSAYVVKKSQIGRTSSALSENELYDLYNIRIVSFEIAPPIENTFVPAE